MHGAKCGHCYQSVLSTLGTEFLDVNQNFLERDTCVIQTVKRYD